MRLLSCGSFPFLRRECAISCVFAANILHSESTSFTSTGESRRGPPVEEISSAAFSSETSDLPSGESRRLRMRTTGSSPTVTTTHPVGVQDQRLPDFFAYPSRVRTFRSQEYALFCQRGAQKGYADHLKTAYPCRRLVHINQ